MSKRNEALWSKPHHRRTEIGKLLENESEGFSTSLTLPTIHSNLRIGSSMAQSKHGVSGDQRAGLPFSGVGPAKLGSIMSIAPPERLLPAPLKKVDRRGLIALISTPSPASFFSASCKVGSDGKPSFCNKLLTFHGKPFRSAQSDSGLKQVVFDVLDAWPARYYSRAVDGWAKSR